jgi:hypothetical protein
VIRKYFGLKNRKKIARKELGKNETQNIAANGLAMMRCEWQRGEAPLRCAWYFLTGSEASCVTQTFMLLFID